MHDSMQLVIVTGMSGAGKTVAMQSFEDLGYFCVDNMPPALMGKFWELIKESGKIKKVALVIDLRSRAFYEEVVEMIRSLEDENGISAKIVFLDASDENWLRAIRKREGRTRLRWTDAYLTASCANAKF